MQNSILCLDFGTSSIRAALTSKTGVVQVLPIGKTSMSALDDASIRSDVLVETTGGLLLAEEAIRARSKDCTLYEASPKLWLNDPDSLSHSISSNVHLSRELIITLVLAHALSNSCKAAKLNKKDLESLDVRVSHPIWEPELAKKVIPKLDEMLRNAKKLCLLETVDSRVNQQVISKAIYLAQEENRAQIEIKSTVKEPIAAALTLAPEYENTSRIFVMVDVGAGTTDIGVFLSVYPDSDSPRPKKLIPVRNTKSIFKAGNYVDSILLEMIKERAHAATERDLQELKRRIRQVKETLFIEGRIREPSRHSVTITVDEFCSDRRVKKMASELWSEVLSYIKHPDASNSILTYGRVKNLDKLDLVVAGGGSQLPFISQTLTSKEIKLDDFKGYLTLCAPTPHRDSRPHEASLARLAVAMGGARQEYSSVKTRFKNSYATMRGGM